MHKQVVVNGLAGVAANVVGYYGEFLQLQTIERKIPYEWYMGYMSDLFLPAGMVSLSAAVGAAMISYGKKYKMENREITEKDLNTFDKIILGMTGLVVAGATSVEYLDSIAGLNFDWKDAVCYAAGSSVAYGIYKFSRIFERD